MAAEETRYSTWIGAKIVLQVGIDKSVSCYSEKISAGRENTTGVYLIVS